MYIPSHYYIEDKELIYLFLKENSFGLLFCMNDGEPLFTHLPFHVEFKNNKILLYSHLASSNPQAKALRNATEVKVIFTGPNAYISPNWYQSKPNVPTWNYISVHLTGRVKFLDAPEEKWNLLKNTILFYNDSFADKMDQLPSNYTGAMMNEITAFEIEELSIEAKFKLSQNKTKSDILGVMENLMKQGMQNIQLVSWMEIINKNKLQNLE